MSKSVDRLALSFSDTDLTANANLHRAHHAHLRRARQQRIDFHLGRMKVKEHDVCERKRLEDNARESQAYWNCQKP